MKPFEHAGKKYTNADAWRTAKATVPAKGLQKAPVGEEELETGEMQPHHEAIHEHLRNMHEETGTAHTHIEHHGDGSHTSHHIDGEGEIHGPHDHENLEALKGHMDKFLDEEGKEGEGEEEEKEGY